MTEQFASYVQEVESTWVKTTHRVRIKIGQSAGSLLDIMKNVPPNAIINEVIGDQDHDKFQYCGEILFTEEREA